MRIIHLTAPAGVGGLETVVQGLATGQRERGHEVHLAAVVHQGSSDQPFLDTLRAAGVAVHEVRVSPRGYLAERGRMRELLRRVRPHVLHSHGFRPDVIDASVGRRLGIPSVTTVHGHNHDSRRERASEWVQHRALRSFDAVIAVSGPLVRRLRQQGIAEGRIHLVPNAWRRGAPFLSRAEARERLALADGPIHIGWIGRLEPEKGPDVFLDALGQLGGLSFVGSLIGEGRMGPALRGRPPGPLSGDRIRWHGVIPDAARLLLAFDLVVLSSRTEGSPMILLEAMAAGVPLVCSRVGGVPEMVADDEALLVPPEDPGALAGAIRTAALDEEGANRRARAASARLRECFDPADWITRHEAIYRHVSTSSGR